MAWCTWPPALAPDAGPGVTGGGSG